ncbi:hypothetical protein [Marilutibacter spongiae]|nr:hypothetical protein [Lysobacter spongiae]
MSSAISEDTAREPTAEFDGSMAAPEMVNAVDSAMPPPWKPLLRV